MAQQVISISDAALISNSYLVGASEMKNKKKAKPAKAPKKKK